MANLSIECQGLCKKYEINMAVSHHDTLRDKLSGVVGDFFSRRMKPRLEKKSFQALNEVTFNVEQGEIVGIIGHNGAGKSTLLKVISQITEPSNGRVKLYGRVGSLLEVGTGFHPELTGRENIYLNGAIIGMKKNEIRRRFDEIVEFAEIGKFLDVPVKRFSSGMYVRLAFAVSAHLEPEVLLVDEVLAVGDAAFQKKCLGKMGSIVKSGRAVVFISHNMTAINSLCERVIWLDHGKIIDDGPTVQVVPKYLAASVIGENLHEESWEKEEGPGNDSVRLQSIRVINFENLAINAITMQTSFIIRIIFKNLIAGNNLNVTIHLINEAGIIVFTSGCLEQAPMVSGLFCCECHIPGNLLNTGVHRFNVLVVKDTSHVLFVYESRVSFTIVDTQARQGSWYGREPGVVQPRLKWTKTRIDVTG